MKRRLLLRVESAPLAQPRAKTRRGFGGFVSDKHPIHAFKAAVRAAAARAMQGRPALPRETAVALRLSLVFRRLPSHGRSCLRTPKLGGGDCDNLQKAIQDALQGLVFVDDSQVWDWSGKKWLGADGELPSVEVEISW